MAKKRDLVITIDPDGNVNIQVEGVGGKDCVDFSKFLEDELGDVTEREFTSEYYQEGEVESEIKVGE
ncbi:MAG: DUF2997 domain-containing protein [Myxococcota bacterium]